MKPIKLTIKGLNSFQEEQSIAFDALTSYGLFGVFGPTGSGKSTLLDGMTLALYGKTSRDSSNFINVQSDRAQISYEFTVADKHYRVIRTYKRNSQGSTNATKPTRIERIEDGVSTILEEQTTLVDKKCLDIIGLEFKDFIRTVVLPQGKFSEFIQLKGRDRRDMLERLFDLSKYGDDLSRKLSSANRKEKDKHLEISGELKGYESVSTEREKALTDQLKTLNKSYDEKEKYLLKEEKQLKDLEEQFELTVNLERVTAQFEELKKEEEAIEDKKLAVEEGQKILRVQPYYHRKQSLNEEEKQLREALEKTNVQLEIDKAEWEKIKKAFSTFEETNGDFFTSYDIERLKLEEKLTLSKTYKRIQSAVFELQKKIEHLYEDKKDKLKSLEDATGQLNQLNDELMVLNKETKALQIPIEKQKSVDEGAQLEEDIKKEEVQLKAIDEKLESFDINEKNDQLTAINDAMDSLYMKLEGLSFSEETYLNEKQDVLKALEDFKSGEASLHRKLEEKEALTVLLKSIEDKKSELQNLYEKHLSDKEKLWIHQLKKGLKDGEACPVCGSEVHNIILSEIDVVLDETIEQKMQNILVEHQSTDDKLEGLLIEIKELEERLSTKSIESFNSKLDNLDKTYHEYKSILTEKNDLASEKKTLQEMIGLLKKQWDDHHTQREMLDKSIAVMISKLDELKKHHVCDDFTKEKIMIYSRLSEYQEKMRILEKLRSQEIKLQENTAEIQRQLDEIMTAIKLDEQVSKQQQEKLNELKDKVEELDYDKLLEALQEKHKDLTKQRHELQSDLDVSLEKYNNLLEKSRTTQVLLLKNQEEQKTTTEKLNDQLKKETIDIEMVSSSEWTVERVEALSEEVKLYQLNMHSLNTQLNELKGKLKKTVTEEIVSNQKKIVNELKSSFDLLIKEKIVVEQDLKQIRQQLEEMKSLIVKKESIEYKLSLLKDLESLFKGKKFVEFVAAYHLRYISVEASERLFDITSGKYGLEVDDHGKFLIRDYSHGGELRDTSTLSGGESFLVSLSLALSLSSQIQLKGRAPLELFFLDEGFGTLDERFLELVMTSLERIHHERLSIGLISHVDSIKNRVPIKLEVSPSISGIRGSRIKIERT